MLPAGFSHMSTQNILDLIHTLQLVLIAIAAAVSAVVPAYVALYAQVRKQSKDLNGVGAKVDQHDAQIQSLQGGGAVPPAAPSPSPLAYPLWNQLQDPLPDGSLPTGRYNECGEECVSMVLWRQHGVEVAADALRAQLGGPKRTPLTTGADLVKLLNHNHVAASSLNCEAVEAPNQIVAANAEGRGVIALGQWLQPTILHWILVIQSDRLGCTYHDPWGGVQRYKTWVEFRPMFAGELVLVLRRPDAL